MALYNPPPRIWAMPDPSLRPRKKVELVNGEPPAHTQAWLDWTREVPCPDCLVSATTGCVTKAVGHFRSHEKRAQLRRRLVPREMGDTGSACLYCGAKPQFSCGEPDKYGRGVIFPGLVHNARARDAREMPF